MTRDATDSITAEEEETIKDRWEVHSHHACAGCKWFSWFPGYPCSKCPRNPNSSKVAKD